MESNIQHLIEKNIPGGRGREPTFDNNTLSYLETTIKDARVFSGTLQFRVYGSDGDIFGPDQYIEGIDGMRWEKGYWIPCLFTLDFTLQMVGSPRAGLPVILIFPKGTPQAGVAIPCQKRGDIQDSSSTELSTTGPNLALGNWGGGDSWI